MPQIINTNIASLNAQRNLNSSQAGLHLALQRLSSGLRVNSARDDAAGLAVAERMSAQARGMAVAIRNANDGISMAQTAESGLSNLGEALQRMRELAVQSANATYSDADRTQLENEFDQLQAEIARVAEATKFNSQSIIGSQVSAVTGGAFQIGPNSTDRMVVSAGISAIMSTNISAATASTNSISAAAAATAALSAIDASIDTLNTMRATWGAVQNRFTSIIGQLQSAHESQVASRSRIMDADFAAETAALTRAQILQQAGVAMLAQANSVPNNVLNLLR